MTLDNLLDAIKLRHERHLGMLRCEQEVTACPNDGSLVPDAQESRKLYIAALDDEYKACQAHLEAICSSRSCYQTAMDFHDDCERVRMHHADRRDTEEG